MNRRDPSLQIPGRQPILNEYQQRSRAISAASAVSLFCSSHKVVVTSATISDHSSRLDKCVICSNNLRKEEVCQSFPSATSTWRGSEFSFVLISTFRSKTAKSPTTHASLRPSRRFSSRLIRARE